MNDPAAPSQSPSNRTSSGLKTLFILGLTALLGGFWLLAQFYLDDFSKVDLITPAPCDLSAGPCQATRGTEQIRFAIESPQIGSHALLQLRVHLEGLAADSIEVDFQGRDMYMGINRVALNKQADGSYWGEGRLPVCTTGEMPWRARVIITQQNSQVGSWFDFMAE
jgi:hypothetical protein